MHFRHFSREFPLVLQRLGFFSDMVLKRTTNSIKIWRNILDPEKIMDGEALMVLLEWTIHGSSGNDKLGLPGLPEGHGWSTGPSGSPGNKKMNPNMCLQGNAVIGCASR